MRRGGQTNAMGRQFSSPLVIAHRGASAYRPENTLPAYELAVEQGADMIEIDLHLTRDSQIVIAHDPDLEHPSIVPRFYQAPRPRRQPIFPTAS